MMTTTLTATKPQPANDPHREVAEMLLYRYDYIQADHETHGESNWDIDTFGRIHALVSRIMATNDPLYIEVPPHQSGGSLNQKFKFRKTSPLADELTSLISKAPRMPEDYVLSPYITLFIQGMEALAKQGLFFYPTLKDQQELTSQEQKNLLVQTIRERLKQKDVKLKADLVALRQKRTIYSLKRYLRRIVDDALLNHEPLHIARVDMAYQPLYHQEIKKTQIFKDINTLLNKCRHRFVFKGLVGYVWIPFCGEASHAYAHLTLIFRKNQMAEGQDIQSGLDDLWREITRAKGGVYPSQLRQQVWKSVCQGAFSTHEFDQLEILKDALSNLYQTAHLMPPVAFARRRFLHAGRFKPQTLRNTLPLEFNDE
ncbi:MAG: inovirus-type Gp2 protein [Gammaproteobacteria bacterium]|nr:inovirus-type Gp2 protein [Gammaproteobacteria bacterium]